MKIFELSSKKRKDGKRKFTALLYKLQPPEYVADNIGIDGHWNENGITFLEQYAVNNLESIKDMSITCDFLDTEKTEISGHGETDEFTDDNIPIFESDIIGHFTDGYIDDYEENGEKGRAVYGKGIIDEMRHPNFVKTLESNIAEGIYPSGSIEIFRPTDSDKIIYLNGKFEKGRIPVNYIHSGYALVQNPADKTAKMIELNNNKNNESEEKTMDEKMLSQFVDSIKTTITEINSKNSEYEAQISELNSKIEEKDGVVSELNATVEQLQKALDDLNKEHETYWAEREELEKEIASMKIEKRIAELNSAISEFSEDDKAFAKDEIEAFNADPMSVEINTIVDKIYVGIGKKSIEDSKAKTSEINSKNETMDIYGEVCGLEADAVEEISIY